MRDRKERVKDKIYIYIYIFFFFTILLQCNSKDCLYNSLMQMILRLQMLNFP